MTVLAIKPPSRALPRKISGTVFLTLSLCLFGLGLGCDPFAGEGSEGRAGWDAQQLEAKLIEVFGESDPYRRLLALAEVLPQMNSENASGAGSALLKSVRLTDRSESDPIVSRWISLDAPAAIEWTNTRGSGQGRDVIAQAIYSWVALDGGAGAVEFGKTVPPETSRYKIVQTNLIKGLGAGGDLSLATEILAARPDGDRRNLMLDDLSVELVRKGRANLKNWIISVPNDAPNKLKEAAFMRGLGVLAGNDSVDTAQWYDSLGLQPYKIDTAMYRVASTYVLHHPAAAYEWMLSQPPSETREHALRDATYLLLKRQPMEAWEYLRANMAREGMGPAMYAYAHVYAQADPEQALEWAIRIPERTDREKAVLLPLQALGRQNLDAARKWIKENNESFSEVNRMKFEREFGKK
jgi:hypothetical protein